MHDDDQPQIDEAGGHNGQLGLRLPYSLLQKFRKRYPQKGVRTELLRSAIQSLTEEGAGKTQSGPPIVPEAWPGSTDTIRMIGLAGIIEDYRHHDFGAQIEAAGFVGIFVRDFTFFLGAYRHKQKLEKRIDANRPTFLLSDSSSGFVLMPHKLTAHGKTLFDELDAILGKVLPDKTHVARHSIPSFVLITEENATATLSSNFDWLKLTQDEFAFQWRGGPVRENWSPVYQMLVEKFAAEFKSDEFTDEVGLGV